MDHSYLTRMLVVNLLAGPGCGKSTTAAGVFHILKTKNVSVELVTEYAKDLTYEERFHALGNQPLIVGKQYHRLRRLLASVQVVITDSPLLLSILYNNGEFKALDALVLELYGRFTNLNYFLKREKPYHKIGRNQTEDEARSLDVKTVNMLETYKIPYQIVPGNQWGLEQIVRDVLTRQG